MCYTVERANIEVRAARGGRGHVAWRSTGSHRRSRGWRWRGLACRVARAAGARTSRTTQRRATGRAKTAAWFSRRTGSCRRCSSASPAGLPTWWGSSSREIRGGLAVAEPEGVGADSGTVETRERLPSRTEKRKSSRCVYTRQQQQQLAFPRCLVASGPYAGLSMLWLRVGVEM